MKGLTSQQAWTHEHIVRCTCGAWLVVTEHELRARAAETTTTTCPHINPAAMGDVA